jgi:hypothetical protein
VDPLVRDRHPAREMRLERREGLEGEVGEPVALHLFDARFGLAFSLRAVRCAGTRLYVPVATEREVGRMKHDSAGRAVAPDHQRPRIVAEDRPRHAAEVREGGRNALAPIILALIAEGVRFGVARGVNITVALQVDARWPLVMMRLDL